MANANQTSVVRRTTTDEIYFNKRGRKKMDLTEMQKKLSIWKEENEDDYGYNDFFTTQEMRDDKKKERVETLPLDKLVTFKNHPFKVIEDDKMVETVTSIKENGVLVPIIVRPTENDCFEIISGHRRTKACEIAGINEIPALIKNLTDDEATIIMVDSNIQREKLRPSEKAWAYKMKLDAMKRQGKRNDLTSCQLGTNLRSDKKLSDEMGESGRQIQRYIRLTNLISEFMDMVDNNQMGFSPAVEISFLDEEMQEEVLDVMEMAQCSPSLAQAQQLKKIFLEGNLSRSVIEFTMKVEKKKEYKWEINPKQLAKKYPAWSTLSSKEMEIMVRNILKVGYEKYVKQLRAKHKENKVEK